MDLTGKSPSVLSRRSNISSSFTNLSKNGKLSEIVKSSIVRNPSKSYKRIATDEDSFYDNLGEIIERDFFPALAEAKGKKPLDNVDPKLNLGVNEYLEVYYNSNRCEIPNIKHSDEFVTRKRLCGKTEIEAGQVALNSINPLATATPCETLTRNLPARPMSNDEILRLADTKATISHKNTQLLENPFHDEKNQALLKEMALNREKTKVVSVRHRSSTSTPGSVALTPSIDPAFAESPIMTFGLLEKTPSSVSSSWVGFTMKPISNRERIAHELERTASNKARKTPSPSPKRSKLYLDYVRGVTPSSPWSSSSVSSMRQERNQRSASKTPTPKQRMEKMVRLRTDKIEKAAITTPKIGIM